jgi:hypothetical protein
VFVQAPRRAVDVFLAAAIDDDRRTGLGQTARNRKRRSRYHGPFAAEVDFHVTLTFASNQPAVMCARHEPSQPT